MLLDIFDKHEEMSLLFACLARSPALWGDDDDEQEEIAGRLIEKGFLAHADGFSTTTPAGRDALIAYVRGEDVTDEDI